MPKVRSIRLAISTATRTLLRWFAAVLTLVLLLVGVTAGTVAVVVWRQQADLPEFREGVRVQVRNLVWVRRKLLSLPAPVDIGYAETGDGCHTASGALLLRSHRIRRVLTTIGTPVCRDRESDAVLQAILDYGLPKRPKLETSAYWIERVERSVGLGTIDMIGQPIESEAADGLIRIIKGDPWPDGFLINCSRDRKRYSLRALLPDPGFGGGQFQEIASVGFWRGTCMDERHWPKIEALVDLIWSLEDYLPDET